MSQLREALATRDAADQRLEDVRQNFDELKTEHSACKRQRTLQDDCSFTCGLLRYR